MTSLSITAELAALSGSQSKGYAGVHAIDGYERGCGRSGTYSGHAHRKFYDVIFAPSGLSGTDLMGGRVVGTLLVVPPRTYFGALTLGDFFFIKFAPEPGAFELPDKVDERLGEGSARVFSDKASLVLPWYPRPSGVPGWIRVRLDGDQLTLSFSTEERLHIRP